MFKKSYADLHLVKGEMEREYVLAVSEVEPKSIEIGAPPEDDREPPTARRRNNPNGDLVFFSQPFEISGGRAQEIYAEMLPRLAELARRTNRNLVIKLHPFESVRGRKRLLQSVLPAQQRIGIEVSRAPAPEIMRRTWCAVGVDSTVAVECTLAGIPYFLCGWLDFNGFGYMQQFARFGAGMLLETPDQILSIPEELAISKTESEPGGSRSRRLWQPIDDARLDEIMFGPSRVVSATKCAS